MHPADTFRGTDRFEIEERLGSGAFGVVYRAYDRKMKSVVALKSLRKADPSRLYRFKQEFRSLADITHPNLVTLYELQATDEEWFFTMELIHGVNFLDYVRGGDSRMDTEPAFTVTLDTTQLSGTQDQETVKDSRAICQLSEGALGRLRAAFQQLAEGLVAIHSAGILHRDIKPSNVLVTPEGRVVVLDFGLVTELAGGIAQEEGVAGTPAYMSPEQSTGQAVGQPSDWFGAGVMLYEALAGRLPFPRLGRGAQTRARYENLAPPSHWAHSLPSDLSGLCMDLLQVDAGQRPSGRDVLKRLQGAEPLVSGFVPRVAARRSGVFVGRESHLGALREAFAATHEGHAVAVRVFGRSGMGKSALIRHFLDELRNAEPGIVILSGRCYERESVPYKALDSLVDTLSQYLQKLPHRDAERLMPRDVASLARLFPVLRRVEAVIEARNRSQEIFDSQELRRRAFSALRDLLGKLGESRPLVLFIDDLQWGDLDSAGPLEEILREPGSPALLLIASYRSEEAASSPLLRALEPVLFAQCVRGIEVGELSGEEARSLASALTGGGFSGRAASIAAEAGGSPFFIELLRSPRARTGDQHLTLDDVIYQRVSELPERARNLLEVVAVSGKPVAEDLARRAADFGAEDLSLLHLLRTERMLRGRDVGDRDEIETYHDRIRETILAHLEPAKAAAHHLRLAHGYESTGRETDPETVAVHYERGGDKTKAAVYAVAAARQAADALAFDRAARLYRLALDLDPGEVEHSRALNIKLGGALANAGRGDQAARAYLEAAKGASAAEALDLRRRASEQLLLSGHIDEGMKAMRGVLESVGLRMAKTPRGALASLLLRRALVRLRGIKFKERDFSEVVPADLVRIDACWSVGAGLAIVDNIYAADFQSRHLLLALKAGEPYRIARALAMEAGHAGTAGRPAIARCEELLAAARAVAARVRHPYVQAHIGFMTGMVCFSQGRWQAAREYLDSSEALRAGQDVPTTWEST
ncbi:MAG: serine/threonine-protein kinase PknK, partial [Bryobacterales bacterium]|nr:serine/threonine-protein kinase PknK [Bryobacterales bacterium]